MNGIQGTNQAGRKWNRLLDAVVITLKYNKITIDRAIFVKVFSDWTVSYIKVSANDVLNTANHDTLSHKLRRVFGKSFDIKVQEVSFLK